jgi:hypothetical protein
VKGLIKLLRADAEWIPELLAKEAADTIETQAAEIERLKADLEYQTNARVLDAADHSAKLKEVCSERKELRAELEQLRKAQGEPYGIVYEYDGYGGTHQSFRHYQRNGKYPDRSFPVFTHPASEQLTRQAALLKIAVAALERYCDDKCNAEYNPCAAREALKEIGEVK